MECKKCNKSLFLQSYDGLWHVDIKNKKVRLINRDFEEDTESVIDNKQISFCPFCGCKFEED